MWDISIFKKKLLINHFQENKWCPWILPKFNNELDEGEQVEIKSRQDEDAVGNKERVFGQWSSFG